MAHILLIEDDRSTHHVLRENLALRGWQVSHASSLDEGIALIDDGLEPDGLLLDLNRPDRDGERVLMRQVRTRNLKTRVVIVTELHDQARVSELSHLRPDVLLQKPIDPDGLCLVLDSR